jgi:hypothetical protein
MFYQNMKGLNRLKYAVSILRKVLNYQHLQTKFLLGIQQHFKIVLLKGT